MHQIEVLLSYWLHLDRFLKSISSLYHLKANPCIPSTLPTATHSTRISHRLSRNVQGSKTFAWLFAVNMRSPHRDSQGMGVLHLDLRR